MTEAEKNELLRLLERHERERVSPKFEAWREPAAFKIAQGGRGAGAKSESACSLLVQAANERKLKIACLRETQNSLEESVHSLLVEKIRHLQYKGWKHPRDRIYNIRNGSYFIFRGIRNISSAHQIKSLSKFDIFFIEEASTISHDSLNILLPTLREGGAELWAVYNREEELDPIHDRLYVHRQPNSIILDLKPGPEDNPWWNETRLPEQMRMDYEYDPDEAEHIWQGLPRKQGHRCAIPRALVRQAMQRNIQAIGAVEIGVDVARFGDDTTTIYKRRGMKVVDWKRLKKRDTVYVSEEVWDMADRDPSVRIKIDDSSMGGGVTDILRRKGAKVIPIYFNNTAADQNRYPDIASEMYFTFPVDEADIPDDNLLMQDLSARRYGYDKQGRRKIESKDEFKKRYHHSSDDGDACLLCYYGGKNIAYSEAIREQMRTRNRARG